MKEEKYIISVPEIWKPTTGLRQKRKYVYINEEYNDTFTELQQLWRSSSGKQEWRDVPFYNEK